jgi:hypothetical protein
MIRRTDNDLRAVPGFGVAGLLRLCAAAGLLLAGRLTAAKAASAIARVPRSSAASSGLQARRSGGTEGSRAQPADDHGRRPGPQDQPNSDAEGYLCVLELKRDRTPREVVAQLLDYASWLAEGVPDLDAVSALHSAFNDSGQDFTNAFEQLFGGPPPEGISGADHRLIVVAGKLDGATERIVSYLSGYDVPINAVLFQYFEDGQNRYLARTWVREDDALTPIRPAKNRPAWNGLDWYVSFGEESGRRNWEDARTYGFVSAGGGNWYTRTLRSLPVGGRIWTYIPGTGYVGVGEVIGRPLQQKTPP